MGGVGAIRVGTELFEAGRTIRVGRDPSCEIVIDESRVSRLHLEISVEGSVWMLRDSNSSNGTFLNGDRVYAMAIGDEPLTFALGNEAGDNPLVVALDGVSRRGSATVIVAPATTPVATPPVPAGPPSPVAQPTPAGPPASAPAAASVQAAPPAGVPSGPPDVTAHMPAVRGSKTGSRMDEPIAAVCAVVVVIGGILPWFSAGGISISGWKVSVLSLIKGRPAGGPSAGLAALIAAVLIIAPAAAARLGGKKLPKAISVLGGSLAVDVSIIAIAAGMKLKTGLAAGVIVTLIGGAIPMLRALLARMAAKKMLTA